MSTGNVVVVLYAYVCVALLEVIVLQSYTKTTIRIMHIIQYLY